MKTDKLDEELKKLETEEAMQLCLDNLAKGNYICDCEYPRFRDIKVKVIGLKLDYIYYQAVHVKVLETNLVKDEVRYRDKYPSFSGGMDDDNEQESYIEKVPVTTEWVNVEWLKNFRSDTP